MRFIPLVRWPALLFFGALAACGGDRRLKLPADSSGTARATFSSDLMPGDTADRDPNLGPLPSTLPDTFGGVVPGADRLLRTATKAGLGTFLVDSTGRPFYMSDGDQGGISGCVDNCELTWRPAFQPLSPVVPGTSVRKEMISSSERKDEPRRQITYNGMPLYYYDGDRQPHTTMGEGLLEFTAHWYLVTPEGAKLVPLPGHTPF